MNSEYFTIENGTEFHEPFFPSPIPSPPSLHERKKKIKKIKPAKGRAKTKAREFLNEINHRIDGDKTICYQISRPSENGLGGLSHLDMDFEVHGNFLSSYFYS